MVNVDIVVNVVNVDKVVKVVKVVNVVKSGQKWSKVVCVAAYLLNKC